MLSPKRLIFESALLPGGWRESVLVEINASGDIVSVTPDVKPSRGESPGGHAVPGMPNLHSHAFQRVMAGLAESGSSGSDFWSWREVMYRFANQIAPEDLESVAAQVYVEMLRSGYTAVGEFHYLHHQLDGSPYDDSARMSVSVLRTAARVGIGITHLPVLYVRAGFDNPTPRSEQRRFVNTLESWQAIVKGSSRVSEELPNAGVGAAFHSLRAVPPDLLREAVKTLDSSAPRHIHAAEQVSEVEGCMEAMGVRPVAWLLDEIGIDRRWCLIHATHADGQEIKDLAGSGAVVGLCPTTEANLADGVFSFDAFSMAGGRFGIGSDSNVSVGPVAELQCLEYGQRVITGRRVRGQGDTSGSRHVGAELWRGALAGGAQALGRPIGSISPGCRADIVLLDGDHPSLTARCGDALIDGWIFAAGENPVRHVMVGGDWVIRDGHHRLETEIAERYREVVTRLR